VRIPRCDTSPVRTIDDFEQLLSRLNGSVRKYRGAGVDLIVGEDINTSTLTFWREPFQVELARRRYFCRQENMSYHHYLWFSYDLSLYEFHDCVHMIQLISL